MGGDSLEKQIKHHAFMWGRCFGKRSTFHYNKMMDLMMLKAYEDLINSTANGLQRILDERKPTRHQD